MAQADKAGAEQLLRHDPIVLKVQIKVCACTRARVEVCVAQGRWERVYLCGGVSAYVCECFGECAGLSVSVCVRHDKHVLSGGKYSRSFPMPLGSRIGPARRAGIFLLVFCLNFSQCITFIL